MSDRRLIGSEKYLKAPEVSAGVRKANSLIALANDLPIQTLLADEFEVYVPSEIFTSWKSHCPFAWEHIDGGTDKTFRVYTSNTGYCFALHGMLTPVRLIERQKSMRPIQAARWICDRYGLAAPREPYWERMPKLVLEREVRGTVGGSPAHAVQALQEALQGVPAYMANQYDPRVTGEVERWLERLDEVAGSRQEGVIRKWFRDALDSIVQVAIDTQDR